MVRDGVHRRSRGHSEGLASRWAVAGVAVVQDVNAQCRSGVGAQSPLVRPPEQPTRDPGGPPASRPRGAQVPPAQWAQAKPGPGERFPWRGQSPAEVLALGDSIELRALGSALEAGGVSVRQREALEAEDAEVGKQPWLAWLVDLGAQGVTAQLTSLLAQPRAPKAPLVVLGRAPAGTAEPELRGAMRFARPLDVPAIAREFLEAFRSPGESPSKPGLAGAKDSPPVPPDGAGTYADQSEVSPELAALLREAERRVEDNGSGELVGLRVTDSGGRPSSEPGQLSSDVWAALEQPLDDEEEFELREGDSSAASPAVEEGVLNPSYPPAYGDYPPAYGEEPWLQSSLPVPDVEAGEPSRVGEPPGISETPDDRPTNASLSVRPGSANDDPRPAVLPAAPRAQHSTLPPPKQEAALRKSQPVASPPPKPIPPTPELGLPDVLIQGAAASVLAQAIAERASGCLVFELDGGLRRVVLRDGDPTAALSAVHGESLVAFLALRGSLGSEAAGQLEAKIPSAGRHAGAALIARGYLRQDDLWEVLKSHSVWVLGRVLAMDRGAVRLEQTPPRLAEEPDVFGSLAGAALFVEVAQRTVEPSLAAAYLERRGSVVAQGPRHSLLSECRLSADETALVRNEARSTLEQILDRRPPEWACALWALERLGVISLRADERGASSPRERASHGVRDAVDIEAWQAQVKARRQLVEEGDYFALLGVDRSANGYAIREAYLELRRQFDARRAPRLDADTEEDLALIAEVLEEAYEILRDEGRRARYRKAIEASPR